MSVSLPARHHSNVDPKRRAGYAAWPLAWARSGRRAATERDAKKPAMFRPLGPSLPESMDAALSSEEADMLVQTELGYLQARMIEEGSRAREATTAEAKRAHAELAESYRYRIEMLTLSDARLPR
jgi:hypothetical protein